MDRLPYIHMRNDNARLHFLNRPGQAHRRLIPRFVVHPLKLQGQCKSDVVNAIGQALMQRPHSIQSDKRNRSAAAFNPALAIFLLNG